MEERVKTLGYKYAGPVLVSYVRWILSECSYKGIERIYFLARDGHTLKCIAEKLCEEYGIAIECKYLYCSRNSLRTPSYHLIGDEALEMLFIPSANNTIESLLNRINFKDKEIDAFLEYISIKDKKKILSTKEFRMICAELREMIHFKRLVDLKSKEAYGPTIKYLEQEGLLSDVKYAIADCGWTGSMQRSLRQLLRSAGFKGELTGFYFGMYVAPKEAEDGDYHAFYFNWNSALKDKILFSENLFECWLSAPHGMTVGYEEVAGKYSPIFSKDYTEKEKYVINEHFRGVMEYLSDFIKENIELECYDKRKELEAIRKILHKIMVHPTRSEAGCYGQMFFSDDVIHSFGSALASKEQIRWLKEYLVVKRLYKKFFEKNRYNKANLFWAYGTIAFENPVKRIWYRWNVYTWELLRFLAKMRVIKFRWRDSK